MNKELFKNLNSYQSITHRLTVQWSTRMFCALTFIAAILIQAECQSKWYLVETGEGT